MFVYRVLFICRLYNWLFAFKNIKYNNAHFQFGAHIIVFFIFFIMRIDFCEIFRKIQDLELDQDL